MEYIALPVLFLAALALVRVAFHAYQRRSAPDALLLSLMLLIMAVWAVAYGLQLWTEAPKLEALWAKLRLASTLAVPPLWLAFVLEHTGRVRWLDRRRLLLLVAIPVAALALLWTGPAHHAVGRYVEAGAANAAAMPQAAFWFLSLVAVSYGLALSGVAFLVSDAFASQRLYRDQSIVLLVAALAPWLANAVSLMQISPIPRLDLTSFAFFVTAAAVWQGVSKFRLLDLAPVNRSEVLEGMMDAVVVLDHKNRVLDLNPAAEEVFGSTGVIGRTLGQLASGRTKLLEGYSASALLDNYRKGGRAYVEVSSGEGPTRRYYGLMLSPLGDRENRRANRLLTLHDMTERKIAENQLGRLAHYDSLTGLPNRSFFQEKLDQAMLQARRRRGQAGLLFMDLDRFKQINDTLGHDVGDLLLKEVARRLMTCVRDIDTVSRLAGDEFVVLLATVDEVQDATKVARRIIDALSEPYQLGDYEAAVGVSMGISFYPAHGEDAADLLKNADTAMYRAKALGRNRFELYAKPVAEDAPDSSGDEALQADMERALESGEFEVHYQPLVMLRSGKVSGMEALVRWRHPERGLLLPKDFLRAAEGNDLIYPIGISVLKQGCAQIAQWQEWFPSESSLALTVNLSAMQLLHPDLVRDIEEILQESGLEPASLVLEVPENVVMENARSVVGVLERLRDLGVRLVIDDFGSGYSSLMQLRSLPVEYLKIDLSLIEGLERDRDKKSVVAGIVSLAHTMDLGVIAEGVETSAQFAILSRFGCDLAQGRYLAEEFPPDRATEAISFIEQYHCS